MARLTEAEDLRVGEHAQRELGYGEPFGERNADEHERAAIRRDRDVLARRRRDVAIGEQLAESRGLRRRDDARVGATSRDLAEEGVEPAGVRGRAAPPEAYRIGRGTHAHAAALGSRAVESVA